MKENGFSLFLLSVLVLMATVFQWGMTWKIIVGVYATYGLVSAVVILWKDRK